MRTSAPSPSLHPYQCRYCQRPRERFLLVVTCVGHRLASLFPPSSVDRRLRASCTHRSGPRKSIAVARRSTRQRLVSSRDSKSPPASSGQFFPHKPYTGPYLTRFAHGGTYWRIPISFAVKKVGGFEAPISNRVEPDEITDELDTSICTILIYLRVKGYMEPYNLLSLFYFWEGGGGGNAYQKSNNISYANSFRTDDRRAGNCCLLVRHTHPI